MAFSTSWGRRGTSQSTSWGRRGGSVLTLAALAAAGALVAPAGASGVRTVDAVVTGPDAVTAVREVGAQEIETSGLATVAVARVTPAQAAALRERGLHVVADQPIELDNSGSGRPESTGSTRPSVARLTGADRLTNRGRNSTIAVVDSGVDEVPALAGRVVRGPDFTGEGAADLFGHGTFVAGLAAGDGTDANGNETDIVGVAPQARILSVKVADQRGRSSLTKLVLGMSWVVTHRDAYGIDVLNLSLSAPGETRFDFNPINALAEAAWFSGITVVASAGNGGSDVVKFAPGNDPYVITVGSVNDAATVVTSDDRLSPFSNSGRTVDGFAKPEVTSFGQHVQSTLPARSALARAQTVTGLPAGYGQLSGTSMSTGTVSGLVALLDANVKRATPDKIKNRLIGSRLGALAEAKLDAALDLRKLPAANSGLRPSIALAAAYAQLIRHTTDYASVDFTKVDWYDVPWTEATWTNATWTDATWTNATWTDATWTTATWTDATWTTATWTTATWTDATWTNALLGAVSW